MSPLYKLKSLRDDMESKDWSICSFIFNYKSNKYIVLVKRFVGNEKKSNEYALVKLNFLKSKQLGHELVVEANSKRLLTDAKTIREYFEIEYHENLGDILQQFTITLGNTIPSKMLENNTLEEKIAMVRSLSKSDSEDPNKIYCFAIKRNPKGRKRSIFNSNKTRILRPKLYEKLKNDLSLSFCYSKNKWDQKSDEELYKTFIMK